MSQSFNRKVLFLILINLIIKPIWIFGVERAVQIHAGFEAYGLYFTLFNFTYLLSLVSDMGINSYNIRLTTQGEKAIISSSHLFGIKLILSSAYLVLGFIFSFLVGYTQEAFFLLIVLLFYQLASSFLSYLRSYLTGLQRYTADAIVSVLDKFLLLVLLLPIIYSSYFTDFYFPISYFAALQFLAILISILVCIFLLKGHQIFKIKAFSFSQMKQTLRQLLPFSLFMFLVMAYNKVDSIMLERMLKNGALESGTYAAAYRLLDALSMIPILFASFFYPFLSKLTADKKEIQTWMKSSSEVLIAISIVLAISLSLFSKEWMELLYPTKSDLHLILIFQILIFSIIPIAVYYIFSSALTANGNLKTLNYIAFASLILNVILNLFLIPNYQAWGAALATIISLSFAALAYIYFYHQIFKVKVSFSLWMKLMILALLLVLGSIFLKNLSLFWFLKFVLINLFGLVLMFILNLIHLKKLISLFKFTL